MRGIGSMLHYLCGGSEEDPSKYVGKTIAAAKINNDKLIITFEGGPTVALSDEGQSCCENRYMSCDDKPGDLVGGKLVNIEVVETKELNGPEACGSHEVAFVKVETDKASITLCTHNENNGYYGGFGLNIKELADDGS